MDLNRVKIIYHQIVSFSSHTESVAPILLLIGWSFLRAIFIAIRSRTPFQVSDSVHAIPLCDIVVSITFVILFCCVLHIFCGVMKDNNSYYILSERPENPHIPNTIILPLLRVYQLI
jgi:hypothetical protein